jgi:hypothetical protein
VYVVPLRFRRGRARCSIERVAECLAGRERDCCPGRVRLYFLASGDVRAGDDRQHVAVPAGVGLADLTGGEVPSADAEHRFARHRALDDLRDVLRVGRQGVRAVAGACGRDAAGAAGQTAADASRADLAEPLAAGRAGRLNGDRLTGDFKRNTLICRDKASRPFWNPTPAGAALAPTVGRDVQVFACKLVFALAVRFRLCLAARPTIQCLLVPCRPAAIAGLVAAVRVDPVEREAVWPLAHVIEECLEALPPLRRR